jgi:cytochrome oxidase Cu insertion factor (SCO1/SenC/PrrC family)
MHRQNGQPGSWPARFLVAALVAAPAAAAGAITAPASSDRIQVGQEAPDFALRSPDGSIHGLSDLRGKKSLVLIFFRGTW